MVSFVTLFTEQAEYHFVNGVCRGVREINSGSWVVGHRALGHLLSDAVLAGELEGPVSKYANVRLVFTSSDWQGSHPIRYALHSSRLTTSG